MQSPLEQFEILILCNDVTMYSCTIVLYQVLLGICVLFILVLVMKNSLIVPFSYQIIQTNIFIFLLSMFSQTVSSVALCFFPIIGGIFNFILIFNLLGLMPYAFTVTSQLFATFMLSISLFIGIVLKSLMVHNFSYVNLFIPGGVNSNLLNVFLILIEILSFLISPLSLGISLFANMLAGHTLLYILATFLNFLIYNNVVLLLIIPGLLACMIMLLEICICFIQAYVFIMLLIIYISDIYELAH